MSAEELERIRSARERWERERVGPERKPAFQTPDGIPLRRLYTPEDVADLDYFRDLGFPGEYPYTRGIYPTMYRGRLWTMRQYAGYGTAEESNRRFRFLLEQGQTGLSVAFDLPTQMGYDSDHPAAEAEVGRVGVAVDTLADVEVLFDGIPLDRVSVSMTINATAPVLLAMLMAVADRQGIPWEALDGTTQNDILKEYIARGTYIFPPEPSLRLVADVVEYCVGHLPRWNPISISGYHIREAGATAAQEVAFTFANAIAYVEALLRRGLAVDWFAPRLTFFFNAHLNLFEEVAKFRAARRLWARLMRERFGAQDPRSQALRFHAQTAGVALQAREPDNNVVRVTVQALAAILGGAQSLHTNAKDEALALPTEEAALLALRTQQVLAFETGVADVVDPLGGSYYVEWLTDHIEAAARAYLDRVEGLGGMLRAIETGWVQREISEAAYREQQRVEAGEQVVVGVNRFVSKEALAIPLLKVDPEVAARQKQRLREVRRSRHGQEVRSALDELRRAATGGQNVMPALYRCVRAYATVGEVCEVLRDAFGVYRPQVAV
ncbi:MAG: methylmalonyl-CoA mutase family protein [Armatimonadota bacterium]|nr:methylmalonyl-CoA mutase family protein [Armatimonadota bacterium]MDW8154965.1 methylmalonyl-CoA mutase family protein [Armatimonadota bacterium]